MRHRSVFAITIGLSSVGACTPEVKAPIELTADARAVRVGKADPPSDAKSLGPVEVSDGDEFCTRLEGTRGTYRRALKLLRNRVARLHGNYAQIMTITEPAPLYGPCLYTIRGLAYRLPAASAEAQQAVSESACDPPCSPGYTCDSESCQPVCNPPCASGQVCRADRTCGVEPAE
jgi:hypothetical protein